MAAQSGLTSKRTQAFRCQPLIPQTIRAILVQDRGDCAWEGQQLADVPPAPVAVDTWEASCIEEYVPVSHGDSFFVRLLARKVEFA